MTLTLSVALKDEERATEQPFELHRLELGWQYQRCLLNKPQPDRQRQPSKKDGTHVIGAVADTVASNQFDVWVEGKWLKIDSATAESKLGLLYIGADYRINNSLLVGLIGQFDWADENDTAVASNVDGRGWMVGPYVAARLHQNVLFDGRLAWGRSDNDVTITGGSGSFATSRWIAKGQFTGDFKMAGWQFVPHLAVIYFEDKQDAFTTSSGAAIGEQSVKLGRLTFGPKFTTNYRVGGNIALSPFFAVKGIWDFKRDDLVNTVNGFAISTSDVRARFEAGAEVQLTGGVTVKGEGFYDGIGVNDFDAYGGSVRANVPLQ